MIEIKTFDTILTGLCDNFDKLIYPKTMARSNANIVYLIFKAISKGYEIINNVCVVLSNKYNPLLCSEEDLDSSASLVGTERLKGSASGLNIIITNNNPTATVLNAGVYTYALNDDIIFEFEVVSPVTIAPGSYVSFIAMSEDVGSFPVTAQQSITVKSTQAIPDGLAFSCQDNTALLGVEDETDLAFRKRLMSDVTRQDTFAELEILLRNLPYLFDCRVKFNNTTESVVYDGITIPPYTALICYSGEVKKEIAEKICSKILCPTVQTPDSVAVPYESETFVNGSHIVYITPFKRTQYSVDVTYKADSNFINPYDAEVQIRKALFEKFVTEVHSDYVKEDDVYNLIESLNITGIELLGVNLIYDGSTVDYIEVPKTRVPELTSVHFIQE